MEFDSPLVRRAVAAATVALFFFGVIGAFAVDDSGDTLDAGRPDPGATTTSAVDAGGSGTESTLAGGTATTAAGGAAGGGGGATATTARAGGGGSGANTAPGPPPPATSKPPRAGVYRYERTTTEDGEEEKNEVDVKIEDAGAAGGVTRQRVVFKQEPFTLTSTVGWSADGVRLELTRFESPYATFDCDWTPDSLEFPFPLAAGKAWKVDTRCTAMVQGQQVTIHRTADFKVSEHKRHDVGGTSVAVWVVTGKNVVDAEFGPQKQHEESDSTIYIAPEHGLRVYEKEVTRGTQSGTSEQRLTSLNPK